MTGHGERWDLDASASAHELSDVWDSVVHDDLAHDAEVNGTLVGALYAVDTTPHLSPWQRDQIWDDIVARHMSAASLVVPLPASGVSPDAAGGQPLGTGRIRSTGRSGGMAGNWALTHLATAALLLLTLLAGFAALRGQYTGGSDERGIGIPAPESPSGALAPGLRAETILLQETFDEVPRLASWVGLERVTLAPGAEWTRGRNQDLGEGPLLFGIESGSLTLKAEGPMTVTRSGGAPATVAAGTEVVLNPHDRGFTPSGVVSRWSNTGAVPVSVVDAGITTSGTGWGRIPADIIYDELVAEYQFRAQTMPLAATVHRVSLKPGETLSVDAVAGLEMLWVESGNLVALDRAEAETSAAPFAFDKGTKEAGNLRAGRVFQSADDEPVTLLVMTIIPADSRLTTPTP
jgi:hypothetical protein